MALPCLVNRRRWHFPTTSSSPRHLCALSVSALSFSDPLPFPFNSGLLALFTLSCEGSAVAGSTLPLPFFLDAASSPLSATLTKNTRGGVYPPPIWRKTHDHTRRHKASV